MKIGVLFLGVLFLMVGVIAPGTDYEAEKVSAVEKIELEVEDGEIKWEVEGYSKSGFKVSWSKREGPTYPTRDGDKYKYFSDSEKDSTELEAFDGDGVYYVRVCEYLGGKCGVYSNEVEIELTGEAKEATYEKEKVEAVKYEREKVKDKAVESNRGLCQGCFLDEKCYSIGHRRSGEFCSGEGFVNQTGEGEFCDNSFECSSNVCVDSECVSAGLIRKVLNWLQRFFG